MYLFYKIQKSTNVKENFAVQDDVKAAINEVYQADVDAIRNLSAIATKLQAGGLTAAGNLSVAGELILTGANTWMLHTPDDGRKTLYFGKGANGGIDAWPVHFEENGTINCGAIGTGTVNSTTINADNINARGTLGTNTLNATTINSENINLRGSEVINGNSHIKGNSHVDGELIVKSGILRLGSWLLDATNPNVVAFSNTTGSRDRFHFYLVSDVGHMTRWRHSGANVGRIAG